MQRCKYLQPQVPQVCARAAIHPSGVTFLPWLHPTSLNDVHSLMLIRFAVAENPVRNQQISLLVLRVLHRYHQACHGDSKCYAREHRLLVSGLLFRW